MLKKATPIVVSVALSFGASTAMAGQKIVTKKPVPPTATAQSANAAAKGPAQVSTAQNPQAVKAAKKIELTKDRVIIQRKGPGHVA